MSSILWTARAIARSDCSTVECVFSSWFISQTCVSMYSSGLTPWTVKQRQSLSVSEENTVTVATKCIVTEATALKRRFVTVWEKLEWFSRAALLWKASYRPPWSIQIPIWLPLTSPLFPQPSQCLFIPNPQPLHSTYSMALCRGLNKGCFGSHLGNCAGACVPAALHRRQAGTQSGHVFSAKGPDGISGPLSLSGLAPWNLASWKQRARRAPSAVPCHMPSHPSVDALSGYCEEDPDPKGTEIQVFSQWVFFPSKTLFQLPKQMDS